MKPGEGNARFLADLAEGVSDAEMRKRWVEGFYAKPRPEWVTAWRRFCGR